jgi:hypothetical protein
MKLVLILALALASVGCASKPSKKAKDSALVGTVTRASEQVQGAKKSVSAASEATTSTGNALRDATRQNKTIEQLLEELVKSL